MSDELLKLCEFQLTAVLEDLDNHTAEVSEAASRLLRLSDPRGGGKAGEAGEQHALLSSIDTESSRIVKGLQFHDELAQRICHVVDLLQMLRLEHADLAIAPESEALLARVSAIFSSQAEFGQLARVFPLRQVEPEPLMVELFTDE